VQRLAKGHIPDNTPVNKNIAIIGMNIEFLFIFWGTSMSYLSKIRYFIGPHGIKIKKVHLPVY
jgi:hypothetical protein